MLQQLHIDPITLSDRGFHVELAYSTRTVQQPRLVGKTDAGRLHEARCTFPDGVVLSLSAGDVQMLERRLELVLPEARSAVLAEVFALARTTWEQDLG